MAVIYGRGGVVIRECRNLRETLARPPSGLLQPRNPNHATNSMPLSDWGSLSLMDGRAFLALAAGLVMVVRPQVFSYIDRKILGRIFRNEPDFVERQARISHRTLRVIGVFFTGVALAKLLGWVDFSGLRS